MEQEEKRNFEVVFSENATREFAEIIDYIVLIKKQPINALRIGEELIELIEKIGVNPFPYKTNPFRFELSKSYKYVNFYNWLVFFKIDESIVEIQGIIHGSRKPDLFEKYALENSKTFRLKNSMNLCTSSVLLCETTSSQNFKHKVHEVISQRAQWFHWHHNSKNSVCSVYSVIKNNLRSLSLCLSTDKFAAKNLRGSLSLLCVTL